MVINLDNKAETLATVKNLIQKATNYKAPYRFDYKTRVELIKLANDDPDADNMGIPESSFKRMRLNHEQKDIKHVPFVAALLLGVVGKYSKTKKQYAVTAYDNEALDAKNVQHLDSLQKEYKKFLDEKDDKRAEALLQNIEELSEADVQLQAEKDVSEALRVNIEVLTRNRSFTKGSLGLEIFGEIYHCVDMFGKLSIPRTCDANNIAYLDGRIATDISTSPLVVEYLKYDIYTIMERFDLDQKTIKELMDKEPDMTKSKSDKDKGGEAMFNPNGISQMGEVYNERILMPSDDAFTDKPLDRIKNKLTKSDNIFVDGSSSYDSASGMYKVIKVTAKSFKKRKKVFRTAINEDRSNFDLVSFKYKGEPGEEVEEFYATTHYLFYYAPCIQKILYQTELHDDDSIENTEDNDMNLYAGGTFNIIDDRPFSWLNNIKHLIYKRNHVWASIDQLLADNIGNILVHEFKAKPEDISHQEMMTSIAYNKMHIIDSSRNVSDNAGQYMSLGNSTKGKMVDMANIDNSENITRLFNIEAGIIQSIYKGKGVTDASRGEIGQNARLDNVSYSVQQAADVMAPSMKLFYNSYAALYNIIPEVLKFRNRDKRILLHEILGIKATELEVAIEADTLSNRQIKVRVVVDVDELILLDDIKNRTSDYVNQKVLSLDDYVNIQRSQSIDEILEILQISKKEANKIQQENLKAEREATAAETLAARTHEADLHNADNTSKEIVSKGDNETDIEVALIQASATLESKESAAAFKQKNEDAKAADKKAKEKQKTTT